MADSENRLWFWCVFPSLSMGLGWMLRGYIGGGFLGAMIPGAFLGLALCLLLRREREAAFVTALAAIGIGFGGQETYGQTVGLSLKPESFSWAILGFLVKGGVWGFLGGAILGIAFSRNQFAKKDLIAAFALMVTGTYAGWKLLNQPKLIYFSDRIEKPREELWFGLFLGALFLLLYLSYRGGARIAWSFAWLGFLGGGTGFAAGAAAQVWGRGHAPDFPLGWWKVMELIFGTLLGLTFGYAAWRNRHRIETNVGAPSVSALPNSLALASLAIAIAIYLAPMVDSRLNYTIVGAILLSITLFSEQFNWHIGVTVTYCAFAIDLLKAKPSYPASGLWAIVIVTTLAVAVCVSWRPWAFHMFVLLTWTATGMGLLKSFLPPGHLDKFGAMEVLFVILAAAVSLCAWRIRARTS